MTGHEAGFGGGCHWCTEAVFRSLCGVQTVRQGFIAFKPALKNPQLSESGIFTRSAVSSIFSAIILIIQKALFPCTAAAAMIAFPAHVSVSGTASAVVAEQHHQNDDNAQSNKNPGQNS